MSFEYADESERGRYPIPRRAPIEGGRASDGDRHVIVVDRSLCRLYELFDAHPPTCERAVPASLRCPGGARWHAGSGAVFNLRSNRLRPRGWISADALRFTASRTRRAFIYPARHFASDLTDPELPAMGQRLRLKRSFDISRFPRQPGRPEGAPALRDDPRRQRLFLVRERRSAPRLGQR